MNKINQPTCREVVEHLAAELKEPVLLKDFIQQVLSMWHSAARNQNPVLSR